MLVVVATWVLLGPGLALPGFLVESGRKQMDTLQEREVGAGLLLSAGRLQSLE